MSVVPKIISIPYYDRDEPAFLMFLHPSDPFSYPSRRPVHDSGFLPICFRYFATSLRRGCGFAFLLSLMITPHTYTSPSSAVAQPNVDWIGDILIPTFIISSHWIVLARVCLWLGVIIIISLLWSQKQARHVVQVLSLLGNYMPVLFHFDCGWPFWIRVRYCMNILTGMIES